MVRSFRIVTVKIMFCILEKRIENFRTMSDTTITETIYVAKDRDGNCTVITMCMAKMRVRVKGNDSLYPFPFLSPPRALLGPRVTDHAVTHCILPTLGNACGCEEPRFLSLKS